jgi:hypothetical protein
MAPYLGSGPWYELRKFWPRIFGPGATPRGTGHLRGQFGLEHTSLGAEANKHFWRLLALAEEKLKERVEVAVRPSSLEEGNRILQ